MNEEYDGLSPDILRGGFFSFDTNLMHDRREIRVCGGESEKKVGF